MPAVVRMGEKLFSEDFYSEASPTNQELLNTIKVPKNLLYLTDRLPKPKYDSGEKPRHRSLEDERKRRNQTNIEHGSGTLPQINKMPGAPKQSKSKKYDPEQRAVA